MCRIEATRPRLQICSAGRLRNAKYHDLTAIMRFQFLDVLTLVQCASQICARPAGGRLGGCPDRSRSAGPQAGCPAAIGDNARRRLNTHPQYGRPTTRSHTGPPAAAAAVELPRRDARAGRRRGDDHCSVRGWKRNEASKSGVTLFHSSAVGLITGSGSVDMTAQSLMAIAFAALSDFAVPRSRRFSAMTLPVGKCITLKRPPSSVSVGPTR